MKRKVLIANRGEIACRIIKTCKKLGIQSVAIYTEIDAHSLHVFDADEAVLIEAENPVSGYLDHDKIIATAIEMHCDAIIPGYGFLSENAEFAKKCMDKGLLFVGPSAENIRQFGLKHKARELAVSCGIPVIQGSDVLLDEEMAVNEAETIGFPVLLKCAGGGGGIGMHVCLDASDVRRYFAVTKKNASSCFGDDAVFLEKYISSPRHIEVQIFGDGKGTVVALGERECSIQRRFQKIIEEAPSSFVSDALRKKLFSAAIKLGNLVNYTSAGTVEFIVDGNSGAFFFLEVNTRLQVEHPVTEKVTGIDLVEWMLLCVYKPDFELKSYRHIVQGHAIEVRLCAEDPTRNFMPCVGTVTKLILPRKPWSRFDFGIKTGSAVSSFFDPLLGKIIVHGKSRRQAIERIQQCLHAVQISGLGTNKDYLTQILASEAYLHDQISTEFLKDFVYVSNVIEVVDSGFHTTIQDYPGRVGYWGIGVPPSGPVDPLAFQIANALVGNDYGVEGLEFTLEGPTLRFHCDALIALTGAEMEASIDDKSLQWYSSIEVRAGSVLRLRDTKGLGFRSYLAVRGGFQIPSYLGSKSTFCFGNFGGLHGNSLNAGDILPISPGMINGEQRFSLPEKYQPKYHKEWEIGVIYGPHGAPDFFTEEDMNLFFSAKWRVHHNSNRLGIRLIGPKPKWARKDGGEAGLHPSNIHDCEYAIGAINFTGDMPVILNCDGPSLGGFVCPATIPQAEIWKLGQLSANDSISFKRISYEQALLAKQAQFKFLEKIRYRELHTITSVEFSLTHGVCEGLLFNKGLKSLYQNAVVHEILENTIGSNPRVVYRIAGDQYLLIEYGEMKLDLNLRFRVHLLMEWFKQHPHNGIIELSPGVRSLQVHYESSKLHLQRLLEVLIQAERQLPDVNETKIPSRILKLPLAFDDRWNKEAIERYKMSVLPEAPYLPSNIDFIARINGLEHANDVKQIATDATYLVLGLGDVYLGAPCAVPIDPRHRLVTSKYNPARTYTPEGAVGIGGVYMCIYGMDSPGGYQLIGRTLPIWNQFTSNAAFEKGKPWLLRFFDQIQYYLVNDDELQKMRQQFASGTLSLEIQETEINVCELNQFLLSISSEVAEFKRKQTIAFEQERERWEESGMIGGVSENSDHATLKTFEEKVPDGCITVRANAGGSVWDILVNEKSKIKANQPVVILEAMKTEMNINCDVSGIVEKILVKKGALVNQGDALFFLKTV